MADDRKDDADGAAEPKPHYLGHRERLRERLLEGGPEAMPDYEILEFLLFSARARGDTKPLAKALIARFGSFAGVMAADRNALLDVDKGWFEFGVRYEVAFGVVEECG